MHSLLFTYMSEYRWLGYLIVFVGMIIEGDIFLFTAFFLARSGFFDIGDLTFFAFSGSVVGDLAWYSLGAYRFKILDKVYPWVERITKPFDDHIRKRLFHTLAVSKFTYGIHHPILIRSGMLKTPLRKFVVDDLPAIAIWILAIGLLGYFSGLSYMLIRHYLRYAEVGLLFALVLFYLISHWFSNLSRREL